MLLLIGCSKTLVKPPLIIKPSGICIEAPSVGSIAYRQVKFKIIDARVTMKIEDYENLSRTISETLVHIKQKNAVIKYYKECLKAP